LGLIAQLLATERRAGTTMGREASEDDCATKGGNDLQAPAVRPEARLPLARVRGGTHPQRTRRMGRSFFMCGANSNYRLNGHPPVGRKSRKAVEKATFGEQSVGATLLNIPRSGLCSPRCPKARHLGHPPSLVVLSSPGTWATRQCARAPQTYDKSPAEMTDHILTLAYSSET